ncbi:MAG: InlB B-repeat-containing protein, partial [Treponema sp.]|nr:InlB B-repeat-containing protein [Treponema sp.]
TCVRVAAFAILAFSVLTGCPNPAQGDYEGREAGTGTLLLTMGGGHSRTIMPVWPEGTEVTYKLAFAYPDDPSRDFSRDWDGKASLKLELKIGKWELDVTGFVRSGGSEAEFGTASETFTVSEGNMSTLALSLRPFHDQGRGTFVWDGLEFSSVVAEAVMTVKPENGTEIASLQLKGDNPATETELDLDAGIYWVNFELKGGKKTERANIGMNLHIYGGLTSRLTETFADFTFPTELIDIILSAWNGSEWNFAGHGIEAVHFGFLKDVEGIDENTSKDKFAEINGWFNTLGRAGDKAALKELIDAALLGIAGENDGFIGDDQTQVEGKIEAFTMPNATGIAGFEWDASGEFVTATVGSYPVKIGFGRAVLPLFVAEITIDGDVWEGETLTANSTPADLANLAYRWQRGDSKGGDYADIAGATGKTYLLTADDAGKYIRVEVERNGYIGQVTGGPVGPVASGYDIRIEDGRTGHSATPSRAPESTEVKIFAGAEDKFRFDGWTSTPGVVFADPKAATTIFTMPASDVTVTASWTELYAVTFKPENGGKDDVRYVEPGETLGGNVPADPTWAGSNFKGWYTEANGGGTKITDPGTQIFTEDTTLFAHWAEALTLYFHLGDSKDTILIKLVDKGETLADKPRNPQNEDKSLVFYGWTLELPEPGDEASYVNLDTEVFDRDTDLYAHWKGAPGLGEVGPGGGTVIWYEPDGFEVMMTDGTSETFHYIEAAAKSVGEYPWQENLGGSFVDVAGTVKGTTDGNDPDVVLNNDGTLRQINRIRGHYNTELILKAFESSGHMDKLQKSAAVVAKNYTAEGFEHMGLGWFLPAYSDLKALAASGVEFTSNLYWSSFQYNASSGYTVNLENSNLGGDRYKTNTFHVRPVRVY